MSLMIVLKPCSVNIRFTFTNRESYLLPLTQRLIILQNIVLGMESYPIPDFQEVVRHHAFFGHADCLVESDRFAAAFCAGRSATDGAFGVEVVHVVGRGEAVWVP